MSKRLVGAASTAANTALDATKAVANTTSVVSHRAIDIVGDRVEGSVGVMSATKSMGDKVGRFAMDKAARAADILLEKQAKKIVDVLGAKVLDRLTPQPA